MHYTKIDRESCIACGLCQLIAPNLYEYDENGIAYTVKDNNAGTTPISEGDFEVFKKAYTNCPTGAILRSNSPFE
ncbi:ferredoxin [Jeotgalibaca sp. A127]|uniref:ferredoxin n=1 Tax=Jeotgalibaca sp. A127 TaxID=3457324 RepID=UPI003FD018AC